MGRWRKTAVNPGILTSEYESTTPVSSLYWIEGLLGKKVSSVTGFLMV